MNSLVNIKISGIKDQEGNPLDLDISSNIFLNPFYASIKDIELYFDESIKFSESFKDKVSEIIFNKSIFIDSFLRQKRINSIAKEDLYMIKRDYVICSTVYESSRHIYINTAKSTRVRKELGDFMVERSVSSDLDFIKSIMSDSEKCSKSILDELNSMAMDIATSFVKGSANISNRSSHRLWHYPSNISSVPIASNKIQEYDGRLYKSGYKRV